MRQLAAIIIICFIALCIAGSGGEQSGIRMKGKEAAYVFHFTLADLTILTHIIDSTRWRHDETVQFNNNVFLQLIAQVDTNKLR